jgi:predicted nuclease of predicted toxin-antitoxin system
MKFIIDQQLPPALVQWFEARSHNAQHVYFIGLGEVDDRVIWDHALKEMAVIVTKDADFAERRLRETHGPTILLLRIGNSTKKELFEFMDRAWPAAEPPLSSEPVVEVR